MDILEIGTGTGYNAALLSELPKTGSVTSVEVDPAIAGHARTALKKVGAAVTVITRDGVLGYPESSPCGPRRLWEQLEKAYLWWWMRDGPRAHASA